MTIFSFHPVKTITTGEGGAITTNSSDLFEKLKTMRSHGMKKDLDHEKPWFYEMEMLGYNYRMTDLQSALGISQLARIDDFIKRRREIVEQYNCAFGDVEWITTPFEQDGVFSAFHLYVLHIDFASIGLSRGEVMNKLHSKNIGTQVHYIPVHLQPFYRNSFGYRLGDYPIAESYYERTLSIPLFPKMTNAEVEWVVNNILDLAK